MFYRGNKSVVEGVDLKELVSLSTEEQPDGEMLLHAVFRLEDWKQYSRDEEPPKSLHITDGVLPRLLTSQQAPYKSLMPDWEEKVAGELSDEAKGLLFQGPALDAEGEPVQESQSKGKRKAAATQVLETPEGQS